MANKEKKQNQQTPLDKPADSSREAIVHATPNTEGQIHQPADVAQTDNGIMADGPANYYNEQEDKTASDAKQPAKPVEKQSAWQVFIKPVVVLVAICVIVSALLAFTNKITEPIIAENQAATAEAVRKGLLPEAEGFEDITPDPLPDGIASVVATTNDVGYIIESYANGYGGKVPAMVAFDNEGRIAGVVFTENSETPGLGQKVVTTESFAAQFAGRNAERVETATVDRIANATVSSNAAISAVNTAIEYYTQEILGEIQVTLTPEEQRAALLPDATSIVEISISAEGVTEAYAGDDGNFIIYAQAPGIYGTPITAAVAISADGTVIGLALDTSGETAGYGKEIDSNTTFIESFIGTTAPETVDGIAGSTISSDAIKLAIQYALDALDAAKEAA